MNTYIVVPFTIIIIDLSSMLFANKIPQLFIFFSMAGGNIAELV